MPKQVQQDKRGAVPPDVIMPGLTGLSIPLTDVINAVLDTASRSIIWQIVLTWTPHQVRRDIGGEECRIDGA